MPLWQSEDLAQPWLSTHLGQFEPPQSRSLSEPFLTRSSQLGLLQRWSTQAKLWQSSSCWQTSSVGHSFGAQLSPQSAADSRPLRTPSSQVGAAQLPLWQTPELQSVGTTHDCPVTHGVQVRPPQSTALSS